MTHVRISGTSLQFTEQVDDQQVIEAVREAVRNNLHLTLIDLSGQESVTDACIDGVLARCPFVETLYLDGTRVTEKAISVIIDNCPHLLRLTTPDGENYYPEK
jgi:hypothetical protein